MDFYWLSFLVILVWILVSFVCHYTDAYVLVKVCVAYLTPCLRQPFPGNIDKIRAAWSLRLTARLRTVGYVADEKMSACSGHVCTPHPQFWSCDLP